MKSLKNKKGFTIVELVIVIAVIAILAAVMIPTFSNIVNKANESAAMQKAKNAYTNWLASDATNVKSDLNLCIESDQSGTKYYFHVTKGQFVSKAVELTNNAHSCTDANIKAMHVDGDTLKDDYASTTETNVAGT